MEAVTAANIPSDTAHEPEQNVLPAAHGASSPIAIEPNRQAASQRLPTGQSD
jgi:hypothetical protein